MADNCEACGYRGWVQKIRGSAYGGRQQAGCRAVSTCHLAASGQTRHIFLPQHLSDKPEKKLVFFSLVRGQNRAKCQKNERASHCVSIHRKNG